MGRLLLRQDIDADMTERGFDLVNESQKEAGRGKRRGERFASLDEVPIGSRAAPLMDLLG